MTHGLSAKQKETQRKIRELLRKEDMDPTLCVGPGWWDLLLDIETIRKQRRECFGIDIHVFQIKEKFGGLRYYLNGFSVDDKAMAQEEDGTYTWRVNGGTPLKNPVKNFNVREVMSAFSGVITLAEYISYRTCDRCGQPGTQVGKNWIATLCPDHAQDYDR